MHCPRCGVHCGPDISRFCRNCGFRLDGVVQLMARNGAPESFISPVAVTPRYPSPRKAGYRKAGKILFGAVAFFPLFFALCFLVNGPEPLLAPFAVFFAGLMRLLYARLFEEDYPNPSIPSQTFFVTTQPPVSVLPSYQPPIAQPKVISTVPTTDNLIEPHSVTEPTTSLLNRQ